MTDDPIEEQARRASTSTPDDEVAGLLRAGGHRVTTARQLVWRVVVGTDVHLTAESVAERVSAHDPSVNLASVYRSLALFEEMGLVRQTRLGPERVAFWEREHPDEHFHLVCRLCGSVDHHRGSLVQSIQDHLSSGHGFVPERIDLTVTGLCRRCRS